MRFRAGFQKTAQVFLFEYQRQVFSWRFWLSLIGFPILLAVMVGLMVIAMLLTRNHAPVGVVGPQDLNLEPRAGENTSFKFKPYPNEPSARTALLAGQIQAYYILSPDYPIDREAQLVYLMRPGDLMTQELVRLLRNDLLVDLPPERANRLAAGARVIMQSGTLEAPAQISALGKMLVAFAAVYLLIWVVSSASGFMVHTLSDERENRTLEILVTSLNHHQIMVGKIIAQLGVVLTQIFTLIGLPLLVLGLLYRLAVPFLGELFSFQQVGVIISAGLLTVVLESVLLSTLGVTVLEPSETSIASMVFSLTGMAPLLLYQALVNAPSGPVSLFLTFFPLTSAGALVLRMALGSVPAWQMLLSLAVLVGCTWLSFWLAGRMLWMSLNDRTPQKRVLVKIKTFFRRMWKPRHA